MVEFSHATILNEIETILQPMIDDETVKVIRRWDEKDIVSRYTADACPQIILSAFGEDTQEGPATDTLWRYFGVRVRCAAKYSTSPEQNHNPDPTRQTSYILSQRVRDLISRNPTLGLQPDQWIELDRWGPAQDGIWMDGTRAAGSMRDITCRWRVLEEFDGGANAQTAGLELAEA